MSARDFAAGLLLGAGAMGFVMDWIAWKRSFDAAAAAIEEAKAEFETAVNQLLAEEPPRRGWHWPKRRDR